MTCFLRATAGLSPNSGWTSLTGGICTGFLASNCEVFPGGCVAVGGLLVALGCGGFLAEKLSGGGGGGAGGGGAAAVDSLLEEIDGNCGLSGISSCDVVLGRGGGGVFFPLGRTPGGFFVMGGGAILSSWVNFCLFVKSPMAW